MCLFRKYFVAAIFLAMLPTLSLATSEVTEPAPVTLEIDHKDGGKTGKRHLSNLLAALNEEGCKVVAHDTTSDTPAQLLFDSRPVNMVSNERPDYRLIARAKTLEGELSVRGAILVHASTGIEELTTLQGESISFVSTGSWSGYKLTSQLLEASGVTESRDNFFFVGNHVGALSMLLHSDVYVAAIAEPLAIRWADANDLSIVAVTDEVETSGWWINRNSSEEQIASCTQALSKLDRSRLKAIPAWIDGFVTVASKLVVSTPNTK